MTSSACPLTARDEAARVLPAPPPVRDAGKVSLFLDFDGTLVEIADRPQDVVVAPGLADALALLAERLDGRLAIVSGRSLAMLDQLLGPVNLAMAGSHGGEFRPVGARSAQALADPLPAGAERELEAFAGEYEGLVFEAKPFSAAIHYRQRPELADAVTAVAARVAQEYALGFKHGKMVAELATPGSDKGTAVRHFLDSPPFAGSLPLFVGDDVTDEDAFAAVLDRGGGGVLVGPMRATRALWRLDDVAAVHRWLEEAA